MQAARFGRVCLEEAFKYGMKRRTFGKPLLEHPVIRWKVAEMARQVESTHAQVGTLWHAALRCRAPRSARACAASLRVIKLLIKGSCLFLPIRGVIRGITGHGTNPLSVRPRSPAVVSAETHKFFTFVDFRSVYDTPKTTG